MILERFPFSPICPCLRADVEALIVQLYTWKLFKECRQDGEPRLRLFENRVLRRIFESKRDEVTEEGRKLHNEELYALYCSPNVVLVIKSKRMKWAGHVARMEGERRAYIGFWWGNETTWTNQT